uniref:Right handed beta helix domain-containing protein n=1 Tax=Amphimedon queenslandica TaxID=400682 RepID=A0A1X7VTX6_AMPQE
MSALSALLFLSFLHGISALVISIDGKYGKRGNDAIECIKGQSPCYSVEYVADSIQNSTNITIEIISSALSLQGNVTFIGINELTINGNGASIKCDSSLEQRSGIIFKNCSNVLLNSFAIEYCGLLYEERGYHGTQAMLFTYCNNIYITSISFNNNYGVGLVLYNTKAINKSTLAINDTHGIIHMLNCTFTSNSLRDSRDLRKNKSFLTGGGLRLIQHHQDIISVTCNLCYFSNNSATSVGGALFIEFGDSSSNNITIINSSFIDNNAITSGGAIGITVYIDGLITAGFYIHFISCIIDSNQAIFGGGVAILIPHLRIKTDSKLVKSRVRFSLCKFTSNKAVISSAVDINGNNQRIYSGVNTAIKFSDSYFISNIAGIKLSSNQKYSGQLSESTVSVLYFLLLFNGNVSFINNTGTAVYLVYTRILVLKNSLLNFTNNTGECGGALLFSESAILDFNDTVTLYFINNAAKVGGAICIQSTTIMQYTGTCFLQNHQRVGTFHFINNKATTSMLGDDIFASTLRPCVQLHGGTVSSLFFNDTKMGRFTFLPKTNHSIATAPATVSINNNEVDLVMYPGIPYTMNVTQRDEFKNNVTDLEIFPLFATLLNNQNSSLKIALTHFIANNFIITFKGRAREKGELVLQTTGYSARLLINVTLQNCPPGYIFQFNNDTCYCSRSSTGVYYFGVTHCLENKSAVINAGLWAGYVGQNFTTADCVTSLCKCSIYTQYKECILPLDQNLLNDHVCAPHRSGTLCGSCITSYTVYFHSSSYHCGESTHCQYGPLLYVLFEIIPVTCIFLIILFFNINLTSGGLYSFIFYSQILNNQCNNSLNIAYNDSMNYLFTAFKIFYGFFDLEILEIHHLSFCLFKDATIMDLLLIKYLTTLYAFLLIIATILVLKFNSIYCCIRFCHKYGRRNIRGSIVNALTAFLILCYFHCLVITSHILIPSYVMGEGGKILETVPLYNGNLAYMSDHHLKYVIPAIVCLVFIILPPPLILLLEPLLVRLSGALNIRRNAITYALHRFRMKLKPFLDSFQGCFKDNYRCFAGLFFLYRILLVLFSSIFTGGGIVANATHEVMLFLILFLHCLCRPFEKKSDNNIDSFLLIDLLMINMFIFINSFLFIDLDDLKLKFFIASLQLFLMSLPLIYIVCFTFRHWCKRKCLAQKEVHNFDDDLPARLLQQPHYNTFND